MFFAELLPPNHPSNPFISFAAIMIMYIVISYLIIDFVSEEEDSSSRDPGSADGHSGMSFEELQDLPWFGYRGGEASKSCAICLDAYKSGNICRALPVCKHFFHTQCIDLWLLRSRSCPICRSPFGLRASLDIVWVWDSWNYLFGAPVSSLCSVLSTAQPTMFTIIGSQSSFFPCIQNRHINLNVVKLYNLITAIVHARRHWHIRDTEPNERFFLHKSWK